MLLEYKIPETPRSHNPSPQLFLDEQVEKNSTLHEPSPKHNGKPCDTKYVVKGSLVIQMYNAGMRRRSNVLVTLEL